MKRMILFIFAGLFLILAGCSNPVITSSNNGEVGVLSGENKVFTGYEYEDNQDALLLEALKAEQTRGGFGDPDHDKEGQIYFVSKTGGYNQLSYANAVSYARIYNWIDVNGSGNSLDAALENAIAKAKAANRGIVLVYMAQGLDYWNAEDSKFKSVYTSLIKDATLNGNKIVATSHSWSGHLVADIVRDNAYVTHFAFNPAHGNFKEGEKIADYINDLKATKATTYILAGTDDLVTTQGGGSAWKVWWGIIGYNSVYYAIRDTSKVSLIKISDSGHGVVDMIDRGAMTEVLKRIP